MASDEKHDDPDEKRVAPEREGPQTQSPKRPRFPHPEFIPGYIVVKPDR